MNNFSFSHLSNEVLALQVVAYKTLGINKELATQCMIELSKRREEKTDGNFDFESFIESKSKIINDKNIEMNKSQNILNQFKNIKIS